MLNKQPDFLYKLFEQGDMRRLLPSYIAILPTFGCDTEWPVSIFANINRNSNIDIDREELLSCATKINYLQCIIIRYYVCAKGSHSCVAIM